MAKKTTPLTPVPVKKSILASWFFKQPAKFALLSFCAMLGIMAAYSLIKAAFSTLTYSVSTVTGLLVISIVFSICMLIKWLPNDNLDRRSFVAVDNGLTIIYFIAIILSTIFIATNQQLLIFYIFWLQNYSVILFLVAATAIALIYLYVLGLMIANLYSTYRRALGMGVPKWKAILSLPFTFSLFWLPGYLLPDAPKTKQVIEIKSKWYSAFTNWVVAKPINAVLVFLATLVISALLMDIYTPCMMVVAALVFAVWVWIVGGAKLRKSIGGAFASFVMGLNIALVIAAIAYVAFAPKTQVQAQFGNVEITEMMNQ